MKPKLKEHLFAKLINDLTLSARLCRDTQQLRAWIARDLKNILSLAGQVAKSRWTKPSSAVRLNGQLVTLD